MDIILTTLDVIISLKKRKKKEEEKLHGMKG